MRLQKSLLADPTSRSSLTRFSASNKFFSSLLGVPQIHCCPDLGTLKALMRFPIKSEGIHKNMSACSPERRIYNESWDTKG
jgi:hypothetical protein